MKPWTYTFNLKQENKNILGTTIHHYSCMDALPLPEIKG